MHPDFLWQKSLIGVRSDEGREKGERLGLWIKMLKFELTKYSSLFSGETVPIKSLLDITT